MKKIFTIAIITIMIVITTSCGNLFDTGVGGGTVTVSDEFRRASGYIGDVNRFMPISYRSARSANGYWSESALVEYNSIKQELLDYVEQFEKTAMTCGTYENVIFEPSKKYVEYSMLYNGDNLIRHSIRIFDGDNYYELVEMGYPTCRICEFNANFTYDFSHSADVDFGEPFVVSE